MSDALDAWIRRSELPVLSHEPQLLLFKELRRAEDSGDDQHAAALRDQLVRRNLRLVLMFAGRARQRDRIPLEDIVAFGCVGLLTAIEKFDPGRGMRFSTYGQHWIRQAIQRAADEESNIIRVPVHALTALRYPRTRARSEDCVEAAARILRPIISLDVPVGDEPDSERRIASIRGDVDLDDELERAHAAERVRTALAQLPQRDRLVLAKRYGIDTPPMSLAELAAELGVTPKGVLYIARCALARLRALLEFAKPAHFSRSI